MIASRHKVAAGLVAGVLLLIGGFFFWIRSAATKKFDQMERDVKALHEDVQKRDKSRPPRAGTPVPGNSWIDYDQALAAVAANGTPLQAVELFMRRDPKADRGKAVDAVTAHAATLGFLRSGVRREKSDPDLQWELGNDMQYPGLLTCGKLGILTSATARILAEEGKPREAADLLLDGCQFAGDLGSSSLMICQIFALAIYSNQFDELRDLLRDGALSKGDLLEIEKALLALDQAFPKHGPMMQNESLYLGYTLLRASGTVDLATAVGDQVSMLSYWRYGFSARVTFASAFEELQSLRKRASRSDKLSWSEAQKLLSELEREARLSKNPIVQMVLPGLLNNELYLRERKAQLRLLQAAAAWRATGTCPEIDDPLGGTLLHSEKDGVLRVWSVGRDGADHGGTGTWKPEAGKDILLDCKR